MAEKKYMERNSFLRELVYDANWRLKHLGNQNFTVDEIIDRVFATPVADVAEVRHGEWIEKYHTVSYLDDDVEVFYECSLCESIAIGPTPYCHHCGAKMKGVTEQ